MKANVWDPVRILICASVLAITAAAWSQEPFPEGPGRDTLLLVCTQCHALNRITEAEATASDWEFIVYDMIARGAPVHKNDIDELKEYLTDNFATDQQ